MIALLCCLVYLPSRADQDVLRREVVFEPGADETDKIESEFYRLQKDLRISPGDRSVAKPSGDRPVASGDRRTEARLEKIKQVLYKRHYKAGNELKKQGYLLSAIGAYQRALLFRPQDAQATEAIAVAKVKLAEADLQEAERTYQEGVTAFREADKEGAAQAWKKTLELNPHHKEAQAALEELYPQENKSPEAQAPTEKAPPLQDPTQKVIQDPELLDSLREQNYRSGLERMRLGETKEAAEYFERALKYSPNDEAAQQQLAKARGMAKGESSQKSMDFYWLAVRALRELDYRRGYRYLKDSVLLDPDNQTARKLLSDLLQKHPEVTSAAKP